MLLEQNHVLPNNASSWSKDITLNTFEHYCQRIKFIPSTFLQQIIEKITAIAAIGMVTQLIVIHYSSILGYQPLKPNALQIP
jgi:hypothetical protein